MKHQNRRTAAVLLMGAALSAAPMGLGIILNPAISHAECAPNETNDNGRCTENESEGQWAIDPNLSPAENLVNLQKLPPPTLSEPLIQTSLVDDVPVEVAPTLGLPGVGFGLNLWPDLTPLVTGGAGAALGSAVAAPALLPPPLLPPPLLPPPPPPPGLPPPPPPPGLPPPPPIPTLFPIG